MGFDSIYANTTVLVHQNHSFRNQLIGFSFFSLQSTYFSHLLLISILIENSFYSDADHQAHLIHIISLHRSYFPLAC